MIVSQAPESKATIGRGRNKFENLCPIPLKNDSIKYVQTKPTIPDIDKTVSN